MLIGCMACVVHVLRAQCGAVVDVYPYVEDFENAPAWTSGGTASDWEWGIPAKPLITAAGQGLRSWCVGGLSGTSYADGQQSWLESPCFDLSPLQYPWISFLLFWETERAYDGLSFQYSLDEGATWTNLGSHAGQQDCLNANWFNTANIVGLNLAQPRQGWSGRIGPTVGNCGGGQGSGTWVTASQCLTAVAGESRVKFRFVFGAGTICNAYDGIGVDEVWIGEAPPNAAGFVFTCNGTTVEFQDSAPGCPGDRSWDFGDPASGADNTASGLTVSHTFSSAGDHTVTLTVSGPCNAPSTTHRTIHVPDPQFVVDPPGCTTSGSISVLLADVPPGITYTWDPGGPGASQLDGIGPGTYVLTVDGPDICRFQESFELFPPNDLTATTTVVPVLCAGELNGSVTLDVAGGIPDYTYSWSPAGGDSATAPDLPAGTYTCTVTDEGGCVLEVTATVPEPAPLELVPQADVGSCPGDTLLLTAIAVGGTAPYTYVWSPMGPVVSPTVSTGYTVSVIDANGCADVSESVSVTVFPVAVPLLMVDEPIGCAPHCVRLSSSGIPQGAAVQWSLGDGSVVPDALQLDHCYAGEGTFIVTLTTTDAEGCQGAADTEVVSWPAPVPVLVPDPLVATIDDPVIDFQDASIGTVSWQWSFGDGGMSMERTPAHRYSSVGCFPVSLLVTDANGCTGDATAEVCVEDAMALWVPNAFTPDADGHNDVFGVVTTLASTDHFALAVFDRWGNRVFMTNSLGSSWDGTANGLPLPDGVYGWSLELQDRTGTLHHARGHVTLLR